MQLHVVDLHMKHIALSNHGPLYTKSREEYTILTLVVHDILQSLFDLIFSTWN